MTELFPVTTGHDHGHAHRWLIDEAKGPMSRGVCRVCGAERAFRNWVAQADFSTAEERRQSA